MIWYKILMYNVTLELDEYSSICTLIKGCKHTYTQIGSRCQPYLHRYEVVQVVLF